MSIEQLERELMKLSAEERARVAARLIASLDDEAEVEEAWKAEVRRRDRELDSGEVEGVSWEETLSSIRNRYGW